MPHRFIALIFLALPTLAISQSTAPATASNATTADPPTSSLVVFMPPRAAAAELAKAEPLVAQSLTTRLKKLGYRTATLSKDNFEQLWSDEVTAVGGLFDPATGQPRPEAYALAVAGVASTVVQQTGATLVLFPQIVMRPAEFSGTKAWWDGQTRLVPTRGLSGDSARFSGSTQASSVEILAIRSTGSVAFRKLGGASLLLLVDFLSSRNELRRDLFEDGTEIDEAVAIALEPMAPAGAKAGQPSSR